MIKTNNVVKKKKHEHSTRSEQNRERRRNGRERGVNSRSRGGSFFGNNTDQPTIISGSSARYESSTGRGGGNRSGTSNVKSGAAVSSGVGAYRGKREYRRSKVERGPRSDRQKERDKVKDDKKDNHGDDTSCSEVDEGKLGHLRQKDKHSEASVILALRKTLGKTTLSREELGNLIIEIEGVLSSRPLTYVFSDFQELVPLTPVDLLLGGRVSSLPPARLTIDTNLSNKKMEPILGFGI
ncbi:hypothetical protein HNY73_006383 [Argiope bruennichi]|uniref:Uncharacterized protein n=1 Tax=Argiope bruennichi TaxID=94029 RepID=A0A8T0FKR3_ARGBR|nr:hypothetical protein HNY73_006383 [Argiope bruennichi]